MPRWASRGRPDVQRPRRALGALPADLAANTAPVASVAVGGDDDAGDPALTAADVAASWVLTRHLTRSDDPPGRRLDALNALSGDAALVSTVDAAAPRSDPATGGATWAVVSAVSDIGAGWWRVGYTIKTTGLGHVGPASTAASLDVHIGAGLVIGERP